MTLRLASLFASLLLASGPLALASAAPQADAAVATAPTSAPTLEPTRTIDLGGGVTMEFVLIPAGSFTMGTDNHESDEMPAHRVRLSRPFYLGRFEVTQAQWQAVMGSNPSDFKDPQRPVENVSWADCHRFLTALHEKSGLRFTLPTEAQWEYACRAGTTTEFGFGDDEVALGEHAWFSGNADLTTHPVGRKRPNPWGLYDMHGNVFEWCEDSYAESYASSSAADPLHRGTGQRRILRGGAWLYVPDNLRSSDRAYSPPEYRSNEYGFRCVMTVSLPEDVSEDERTDPSQEVGSPQQAALVPADRQLLTKAGEAIGNGNRYYAELLLDEAAKLAPNAPELPDLRRRAAALAVPDDHLIVDLGGGITMEFVLIKPGTFLMGSGDTPLANEKPTHAVTITKPFYLGKYEVTQEQWLALMSRNLSTFKTTTEPGGPAKLPVENVSWYLCQSFVAKLNERDGGQRFRLPTEAEWEYACRTGMSGGPGLPERATLSECAWFGENAGGSTHPVGTRKPNRWGLHDMYGNVWEWCQDWLGEYPAAAVADPSGPPDWQSLGGKVLRGGAWNNVRAHVTPSFRHDVTPDIVMRYYGFRCAASVVELKNRAAASSQ